MFNDTSNIIMFVNNLEKHIVESCSVIQICIHDFLQFVMFILCVFVGGGYNEWFLMR